ncbi:MAG: transporter substrate-binding domain-containing protein [Phocaeicola sp.]
MKKYYLNILVVVAIIATGSYLFTMEDKEKTSTLQLRDYAEIEKSKVIRAITEYNTLSFYLDDGEIKGFHYELLTAFATSKGWKVEITPEMEIDKQIESIMNGEYDLLANSRALTTYPDDSLQYTDPFLFTQLVLVQRKATSEDDSLYISNLLQLAEKKIYIPKGSPAMVRIQNLSNEIGDTIYIEEFEKYGAEQLLALVAGGDIDYTVCEKTMAQAWAKDLPQLEMERAIGFTQRYAWGVNPHATELLDTLNHWLKSYSETKEFKKLRKKYYNY